MLAAASGSWWVPVMGRAVSPSRVMACVLWGSSGSGWLWSVAVSRLEIRLCCLSDLSAYSSQLALGHGFCSLTCSARASPAPDSMVQKSVMVSWSFCWWARQKGCERQSASSFSLIPAYGLFEFLWAISCHLAILTCILFVVPLLYNSLI